MVNKITATTYRIWWKYMSWVRTGT